MNNLKYLDVLKEQLKSRGLFESNLDAIALQLIEFADANNIPVMDVLEGNIDFTNLELDVIKTLNRLKKYKTCVYGKEIEGIRTSKYIHRLLIQ